MFRRLRDQKGLSLLETTLGILVLSVGFLGLLPMMTTATANTLGSEQRITATYLANEKTEEIIADKEFQGYDFVDEDNYDAESLDDGYSRTVSVYEVNTDDLTTPQSGTGYKKVAVTVSWGGSSSSSAQDYVMAGSMPSGSNSQQITVTTLLTDI